MLALTERNSNPDDAYFSLLAATSLIALGACQTAPERPSGFLQSYEGLAAPGQSLRASVLQRRDDDSAARIERVYIAPSVLIAGAGGGVSEIDRGRVLREVDRQVCYEVSERFTVIAEPAADAATVRAAVVRIDATGQAGSLASATAGFFIPGPIGVRVPGATGRRAAEAELPGAGCAPGRGHPVGPPCHRGRNRFAVPVAGR